MQPQSFYDKYIEYKTKYIELKTTCVSSKTDKASDEIEFSTGFDDKLLKRCIERITHLYQEFKLLMDFKQQNIPTPSLFSKLELGTNQDIIDAFSLVESTEGNKYKFRKSVLSASGIELTNTDIDFIHNYISEDTVFSNVVSETVKNKFDTYTANPTTFVSNYSNDNYVYTIHDIAILKHYIARTIQDKLSSLTVSTSIYKPSDERDTTDKWMKGNPHYISKLLEIIKKIETSITTIIDRTLNKTPTDDVSTSQDVQNHILVALSHTHIYSQVERAREDNPFAKMSDEFLNELKKVKLVMKGGNVIKLLEQEYTVTGNVYTINQELFTSYLKNLSDFDFEVHYTGTNYTESILIKRVYLKLVKDQLNKLRPSLHEYLACYQSKIVNELNKLSINIEFFSLDTETYPKDMSGWLSHVDTDAIPDAMNPALTVEHTIIKDNPGNDTVLSITETYNIADTNDTREGILSFDLLRLVMKVKIPLHADYYINSKVEIFDFSSSHPFSNRSKDNVEFNSQSPSSIPSCNIDTVGLSKFHIKYDFIYYEGTVKKTTPINMVVDIINPEHILVELLYIVTTTQDLKTPKRLRRLWNLLTKMDEETLKKILEKKLRISARNKTQSIETWIKLIDTTNLSHADKTMYTDAIKKLDISALNTFISNVTDSLDRYSL